MVVFDVKMGIVCTIASVFHIIALDMKVGKYVLYSIV